jgi:hypothetical protein
MRMLNKRRRRAFHLVTERWKRTKSIMPSVLAVLFSGCLRHLLHLRPAQATESVMQNRRARPVDIITSNNMPVASAGFDSNWSDRCGQGFTRITLSRALRR